ncbi:General stress protein 18 [bacterium HR13]|nr:General stress protein 18 [bacterium HR13]
MKSVCVFLEELVEDVEFIYPYLRFKEEGFEVISAAPEKKDYRGKKGMTFTPDATLSEVSGRLFDCLFIPGGYAPDRLRRYPQVLSMVKKHLEEDRLVTAVCHGPWVLISAKVVKDRKVTGFYAIKDDLENAGAIYTGKPVEEDGNLITATDPSSMLQMIKLILEKLSQTASKPAH